MAQPTLDALGDRQRTLVLAYRDRDLSVAEILVVHGAPKDELYAALSKAREPFRRPASATPGRRVRRRVPIELAAVADAGEGQLERRLARLLAERIAELEDRAAPGRSPDPDATARALALNVRTLATLRRTTAAPLDAGAREAGQEHHAATDEPPPRSLAALRDELYGHLHRIRDEERARRRAGRARPPGRGDGGLAPSLADPVPARPGPSDG